MFTFLHTYMRETWDAQVKRGLIDAHAGIRFPQSALRDPCDKFNVATAQGGRLFQIVNELRCPFYIDRLQGGAFYEDYDYDDSLVDQYKQLLGERFLGFQMHEWMSNYRGDIRKAQSGGVRSWTAEEIERSVRSQYPYPITFLESMNASELAGFGLPETWEQFLSNSAELYRRRLKTASDALIPCDSYYLAPQLELRMGASALMPEIGRQTPGTRVQMAYSRGMARAFGVPLGAYYEPWGGEPFSACCYQRGGLNEWSIGQSTDFPYETIGENGGSSRSMQRRMFLYAYFAGAKFISEEWGMCNTFYDWRDFELTPYGQIKLDFLRLVDKYPDPGDIYTPVAVVLPEALPVLENIYNDNDEYLGYPCFGGFAETLRRVRRGVRQILSDAVPMCGNETASLINSDTPDAVDLLHADCDLSRYDYIVNLTDKKIDGKKEIEQEDVRDILERLLPCWVNGGVHWFVTKRQNGGRYLVILNNDGIRRTVEKGDEALPEGTHAAVVRVKDGFLRPLEGGKLSVGDDGAYHIELPAGEWFLGAV